VNVATPQQIQEMLQLGKLDVSVPQDLAAAVFPSPRGAFLILLYADSTAFVVHVNNDGLEGGGKAVSFQMPANLPLHFLFIPELIQLRAYLTQHTDNNMSLRFEI
jgi:hypothetical protein